MRSGAPILIAGPRSSAPSRRPANFAGFLACAGLIAYALYTQFHAGLEPCPLCIFQRIGIAALGVIFLIAALHNPRGWGARVYVALIAIAALATIGVAARQIYLQHLPPGTIPSCGAPLSMMLKFMPLTAVIRKVLTGSGECGIVDWTFLGLAMPAWVLIWAAFLGCAGVIANGRRP
ncbi:MAG TPA: disulfide bond formation protein B [Steroidobacteraceae bacterium]|nr:disulfide bond formation protein B [Steroidobacteraceae bacterium]